MRSFSNEFLKESAMIIEQMPTTVIERLAEVLAETRSQGGRVFFLGVGGSSANASHAVNDFRKICQIECYCPTDNVAELTARTNDQGWSSVFVEWLKTSQLKAKDIIFVLSVGGGSRQKAVSVNLVEAVDYACHLGAKVLGIVGRDGGEVARRSPLVLLIPTVNEAHVTPHVEALQSVVLHLLVTHPKLKIEATKWESIK